MKRQKQPSTKIEIRILMSPRNKECLMSNDQIKKYEKSVMSFFLMALNGYNWSPESCRTTKQWEVFPFKVGRISARGVNHNHKLVRLIHKADELGRKAAGLEK